jgi:hypothetical protein
MPAVIRYDPHQRPPAGEVYGLYFPSATVRPEVAQQIEATFRAIAGDRSDLHILVWERTDPHYGAVQRRFEVTTLPALVITKPFAGDDVFQSWDWSSQAEMYPRLVQPDEFPLHVVIEGQRAFGDVDDLARNVERLAILFTAPEEEIKRAMREDRLNQLLRTLAHSVGFLKNITATFSVFGLAMKIGFDHTGATVSAEQRGG